VTDNSPGTPDNGSSGSGNGRPRVTTTVLAVAVAVCVTAMVLAIGVALVLGSSPGSSASKSAGATSTGHSQTELDPELSVPATTQIGTQPPSMAPGPPPESPESALPPPPAEEGDPSSPSSPPPPEPPTPENKEAKPPPPPPEFAVGECVDLSGTEEQPVAPASCGEQESSYAVSGKTEPGGTCPADVDKTQPTESATLCLDIDWTVDSCMQLDGPDPQRVDCSDSSGVRVVEILRDTTDTAECASADQAFVYDQRQYVVCIAKS